MSKLICDHCQAENPPDAHTCRQCGRPVAAVVPLVCINCQAENPPDLAYCERCGALLVDRLGVADADEADDLDGLTDWLREALSGDIGGVTEDPAAEETGLTDWLENELAAETGEDIQDLASESGDSSFTGWLGTALASETEDPGDDAAAEPAPTGLTGWLESELAEETGQDDQGSASESGDSFTGWLGAALAEESEDADDSQAFEPASSGLTAWLDAEMADDEADTDPSPEADEPALTDWLRATLFDETDADAADDELSTTGPLPSWLVELAPQDTNILSLSEEETNEADERFTGSLDWLGIAPSDTEPTTADGDSEAEEWPDDILGHEGPDAESESATVEDDLSLTDWLETDWAGELDDLDLAAEAPEVELSLTDWLDTEWMGEVTPADSEGVAEEIAEDLIAAADSEAVDQPPPAAAALEIDEETDDVAEWLDAIALVEPEAETAAVEVAEPDEEELPDWLSAVKADEYSEMPATGPLPDWLVDFAPRDTNILDASTDELDLSQGLDWLQAAAADEIAEEEAGALAAGTDLTADDWLDEELDKVPATPETMTLLEEGAGDLTAWTEADLTEDMLDTLAEAGDSESGFTAWLDAFADDALEADVDSPVVEEVSDSREDELPLWMSDVAQGDLADADEVVKWLSGEEIGTWADEPATTLDDFAFLADAAKQPPKEQLEQLPPELARAALPDWLRDAPGAEEADGLPEDWPVGAADDDLPEWLRVDGDAFERGVVDSQPSADLPAPAATEWDDVLGEAPDDAELLDLGELPPPERSAATPLPTLGEIPDWMQALKPAEMANKEMPLSIEEPAIATGPLAGLRGVVGIEPIIAQPHQAMLAAPTLVSPEQQLRVALLRRLIDDEPASHLTTDARRPGVPSAGYRLVLTILLLLAIVTGLLLPGLPVELELLRPTAPAASPATLDLHTAVQNAAGRPVLVAFEYTPALAGELDTQAKLLLRQIAGNGSPVITVSQSAAGLAKANSLAAAVPELNHDSIGFLPGEALGLRYLATCIRSAQECQTVNGRNLGTSLNQIALIVLITGERDNLVNWVEQVGAQLDTPVVAIMTQALGPVAAPYQVTGQLSGTLAGLPDGAAYEQLRGEEDGPALQHWQSVTLARWLAVVLLIAGNGWYGLTHLVNRRHKKGRST